MQLPEAKEPTPESSFMERWAYYVSTMGEVETKPAGLAPYFDLLFEASDRRNIEEDKLSIYDKMVRDEIQIKAERDYAIKVALEEKEREMLAAEFNPFAFEFTSAVLSPVVNQEISLCQVLAVGQYQSFVEYVIQIRGYPTYTVFFIVLLQSS